MSNQNGTVISLQSLLKSELKKEALNMDREAISKERYENLKRMLKELKDEFRKISNEEHQLYENRDMDPSTYNILEARKSIIAARIEEKKETLRKSVVLESDMVYFERLISVQDSQDNEIYTFWMSKDKCDRWLFREMLYKRAGDKISYNDGKKDEDYFIEIIDVFTPGGILCEEVDDLREN